MNTKAEKFVSDTKYVLSSENVENLTYDHIKLGVNIHYFACKKT